MKLTVSSLNTCDDDTIVGFTSQYGAGLARWRSARVAPLTGRTYTVELDVDERLDATKIVHDRSIGIYAEGDSTVICGLVETIDDDGMATLRLGPDCIVLVESAAAQIPLQSVVAIRVPPKSLSVTPIGV